MARVFVGMFAFLCLTASPAEAGDLWAWIKELSGPGPFHGKQFDVRLACVGSVKQPGDYAESVRVAAAGVPTTQTVVEVRTAFAPGAPLPSSEKATNWAAQLSSQAPGDSRDKVAKPSPGQPSPEMDALVSALRVYARASGAREEKYLPASGVFYSACRGLRANAPIALGATFRSVHNSPTGPADHAGGNQINLTTMGATVTWRPFNSFKNDTLDWVDVGFAVSGYSFTSHGTLPGGFSQLSGVMLEPIRFEIHLPSSIRNKHWASVLVPFYQHSWVIFPAGFEPNAFGPDLVGEKAQRLPAEWVRAGNIFWDFTPVVHWIGKHVK